MITISQNLTNYDFQIPDNEIYRIILENMSAYFEGEDDRTNTINSKIMVGKGTIIKNHSLLEGPIIIGENCIVDGASIGPHTSIGDNSTLFNCTLQKSIIMSFTEQIMVSKNVSEGIMSRTFIKILEKLIIKAKMKLH
jgi:NDP-sugar pyrophosphorylase family protein